MKHFKKYWYLYTLLIIFLIGLFFRTYQITERYTYAHDADLFGWIVKDIVVNHHLRLIGQLTSANGIYIGPLFYYSLIPFFVLTKMDPVGALIPITILGMITLLSYYFVFSKLFNRQLGLIITFLEAVSIPIIGLDRWVVPSTPTNIWQVWYFFSIIMLARGNFAVLPILGVLISMIWEIHIALIPALIAIPFALFVSKKLPTIKQIFWFFLSLIISSAPLILFEIKHNFIQTTSFFQDFFSNNGGGRGVEKLVTVVEKFGSTTAMVFIYPLPYQYVLGPIIALVILLLPIILIKKKVIKGREMIPLYAWILGVLAFFVLSSTPVSEYYFFNTFIIFTFIVSAALLWFSKLNHLTKYLTALLLGIILIYNALVYTQPDFYYQKGYLARKNIAEFIAKDSRAKGYPCVAVSYITTPGENVGFRYFFWLDKLHVNLPKDGGPVYTIFIPDNILNLKPDFTYGHIGVQYPLTLQTPQQMQKSCSIPDPNLTEPVLGFTTN